MKYYRFISKDELKELLNKGVVRPRSSGYIHVLKENTLGQIIDESFNYKIGIDEFEPNVIFNNTEFYDVLTGIVFEDYLIELTDVKPIGTKLGWYYWKDTDEVILKEYLLTEYRKEAVSRVISGNFLKLETLKSCLLNEITI